MSAELAWSDAKYSVVLRSNIPANEVELLEHFCIRIITKQGDALLHFLCTELDLSNPCYIAMKTFKPKAELTHPVQIPHHYVFLISGSESEPFPIGFDLSP
jgi:hypothetical protein